MGRLLGGEGERVLGGWGGGGGGGGGEDVFELGYGLLVLEAVATYAQPSLLEVIFFFFFFFWMMKNLLLSPTISLKK